MNVNLLLMYTFSVISSSLSPSQRNTLICICIKMSEINDYHYTKFNIFTHDTDMTQTKQNFQNKIPKYKYRAVNLYRWPIIIRWEPRKFL